MLSTEGVVIENEAEHQQNEMNFFFLSKKTRRGRKSNFQLPEGLRCTICLEFDEFSSERIEKCTECQSMFHPSCYINLFPESFDHLTRKEKSMSMMKCRRCLNAKENNVHFESIKCGICNMSSGILQQNSTQEKESSDCLFYHPFCKRLIPELQEKSQESNLRKWRYKNSCHYCKAKLSKDQPVLKCLNSKCKEFYHIPCAIEKGMIFSIMFQAEFYHKQQEESIPFYCFCHNKRLIQRYKEHMYDWNRRSGKYTSSSLSSSSFESHDSHIETVDDSYKKNIKQLQETNEDIDKDNDNVSSVIRIPIAEPKEFKFDFQMPNCYADANNLNNCYQYYDYMDQRGMYNTTPYENDQCAQLINLFTIGDLYKPMEN